MASSLIRQSVKKVLTRGKLNSFTRLASSNVNIIKSPFPDVDIPDLSIPDYIFNKLAPYDKQIAFECSITKRKYTFDDIKIKSTNLNRSLRKKLKLQKNDIVAVLLPNIPEFPIAVLGILLAGLRVTTLNPIYTSDEINKQLKDSGAVVLITLTELHSVVKEALGAHSKMPVITINNEVSSTTPTGAIAFKEFTDNKIDIADPYIDDINGAAVMPYSSGTTGLPKGVLLSHRNIVANIQQFSSPDLDITGEGDVIPAVLPMFHIYGFTAICLASLTNGAQVVTLPKFTPDSYIQTLKDYKATILFTVPPIVIFLNTHPAVTKDMLQSVRIVMCGAAPLGALDELKFKEKAGKAQVKQGYGLSETSPLVLMVPKDTEKPGCIGKVIPNTELKILPSDQPYGTPLGPNQQGELYVRGPQVMLGYHNREKETKETLIDGWLRTGDMFYYDENENFYVTDRIKELIKVKGFQVPPAELEEILRDYPNVNDAAVIGIPSDTHGEVPRAYVVPKPGTQIDTDKLKDFVKSKVAEYKQIRGGIQVVDSIPKNASGKILRRQLKQKFENESK